APHTGAQGANIVGFFGTALAMRTSSPFLTRLSGRERRAGVDYELVAYARSHDLTIGAGSSLPAHLNGQFIGLRSPWPRTGHLCPAHVDRLTADILVRLAGSDAPGPAAPVAPPPDSVADKGGRGR